MGKSFKKNLISGYLVAIFATAATMLTASSAIADTTSVGSGVTFDTPVGLIAQPVQPPVVKSWKDSSDTLSVSIVIVPSTRENALSTAKEFQDWPGSGRSFVNGFGKSNAESLGKALNAKCTFVGVPRSRDLERTAIQAEVETSCKTTASPYVLRSRVIQLVTLSSLVIVRVDSQEQADAKAQAITANIWQSLKVASDQRVVVASPSGGQENSALSALSVSGGDGIKIRDYGLIRTSALVGEYGGGIIGGILFGMLFSIGLMKFKVSPIPALIGAQIVIVLLRILGSQEEGTWEIDPILYIVTGAISVTVLKKWARRRWDKRQNVATSN